MKKGQKRKANENVFGFQIEFVGIDSFFKNKKESKKY